jgi:predicted Zn-dependent protease
MLMGVLAGVAYSGSPYSPAYNQQQIANAALTGMGAGAALSRLSFSKGQENEADYLAAYILRQGGYDLGKARNIWVKMGLMGTTVHGERHSVNSHPDPVERLARWDATTEEIKANGGLWPDRSSQGETHQYSHTENRCVLFSSDSENTMSNFDLSNLWPDVSPWLLLLGMDFAGFAARLAQPAGLSAFCVGVLWLVFVFFLFCKPSPTA